MTTSYDEIPYECKPHYPMHPDCLGTLGLLFGMQPAPADKCRVLELGCANATNLICLADALPGSEFVGLDLSPSQIEAGQQIVAQAGLRNITLKAASILDVDESWGQFDFILSHGVFSWIPPAVQERSLALCRQLLKPQGIAFISYNAYPGWHLRTIVRDMMRYYGQSFSDPRQRIEQARALLKFMAESAPDLQSPYARILFKEAGALAKAPDSYLFHEHLEEVNSPLYFHEFIKRTQAHQLQYVCEAWQHTLLDELPAEVSESLQGISQDLVQLEQFADFLTNRTFRRTLLCHQEVQLRREPQEETITSLYVSLIALKVNEEPIDITTTDPVVFNLEHGATASVAFPIVKAALARLHRDWPRATRVEELFQQALADLNDPAADATELRSILCTVLLRGHLAHFVALHRIPFRFVSSVSERPEVNILARLLAARSSLVPSRRHKLVPISPGERLLLPLIDGTRTVSELAPILNAARDARSRAAGEELEIPPDADAVHAWIEDSLKRYAKNAMLVK